MPRWPDLTLVERVYAKIQRGPDNACWGWTGAMSKSRLRRKKVRYPHIRAGRPSRRLFRVNRLLLVLRDGPVDVPEQEGEEFLVWLQRAWQHYQFLQAAHSCDDSECVNPGHLEWATQEQNLNEQWQRKREATEDSRVA